MREEHTLVMNNIGSSNAEHVTDPVPNTSHSLKAFQESKGKYEGAKGKHLDPQRKDYKRVAVI